MIDLRTDFISRPTSAMIDAMMRAAQAVPGFGLRDVPHLRFWIAVKFCSLVCGRMDLKREHILRVQQFDQQWKSSCLQFRIADQAGSKVLDEPMEIFSRERTI